MNQGIKPSSWVAITIALLVIVLIQTHSGAFLVFLLAGAIAVGVWMFRTRRKVKKD